MEETLREELQIPDTEVTPNLLMDLRDFVA